MHRKAKREMPVASPVSHGVEARRSGALFAHRILVLLRQIRVQAHVVGRVILREIAQKTRVEEQMVKGSNTLS